MELTKAAEACISQAHIQRLSAEQHEELCVEHIFFALLALARYLDPPFNKPEYMEEGKAVRAFLSPSVRSIESASWELRKTARNPYAGYVDAAAVIGRAAEMAENEGSNLTALLLAKAVMESPTPTMRAVCDFFAPEYAREDERYRTEDDRNRAAQMAEDLQREFEKLRSESEKPAPQQKEDSDHTLSQLGALLAMLAALEDKEHESLRQSVRQKNKRNTPNRPRIKRRTKIGFITFRGGAAAAFIQYFLYGLAIPLLILYAIERLTGAVTTPPTPLVGLLIGAFMVFSAFNLVRGVNKLLGAASKALGHTLDLISDCLLLYGLAQCARYAYSLPEMPVWLRVIVCVGSLLVLLVGSAMFKYLADQGDVTKTKIMFQNVEGTPGMIFFRFLTKTLVLPALVASVFWIFRISAPVWLEKTLWILGFLWAFNILTAMWTCMALRFKASTRRHRGEKLVGFLGALHLFWGVPALVLFLHWLFAWFPMKTWVIVALSVWGFFTLILAALSRRSDTGVL